MANIKSLQMAKELSADQRINIKRTFFGLSTTAVYTPTQSTMDAFRQDYTADESSSLKQLLACPDGQLENLIANYTGLTKATMGPTRLEAAISRDHQFAAVQLLGYSDFEYVPLTDVRFFEGHDAELISSLF